MSSILIITLFIFFFGYLIFPPKSLYTNEEFEGEVATDTKTLASYARDVSVFTKSPTKIYFPRNVSDVVFLVNQVAHMRMQGGKETLTLRAGGTCMSGGGLSDSSVIDMTRHMTKVIVDPATEIATVEMGAYFRDIETTAKEHGLMFAPYPSSRQICGIGGMIGNNASGEKSIRFGATSDNIISLEVVLADGEVVILKAKDLAEVKSGREKAILKLADANTEQLAEATGQVRKAASGYRLEKVLAEGKFNETPLFCGAQGTLGIVTKAVLKLVPIPKHLSLLVISAEQLDDIPIIVKEIFNHHPEAVETFDTFTFVKAREHLSEHTGRLIPYVDANARLFILAEFSEETKEATEERAQNCQANLAGCGYKVKMVNDMTDKASIWEVRRNSFLLMRDHNPEGFRAVPCIEDVVVPIEGLTEFITELNSILLRRGINYGFHGHIGEGSLRIVPVFDTQSPNLVSDITGLMEEVFSLIKRLKGNISADHSDGIIRSPFLREFYGDELYSVFTEVKKIYDPYNLFNPGKKTGATIDDIKKYLDV